MRKFEFPTRSDTNHPAQSQKQTRSLKFRIMWRKQRRGSASRVSEQFLFVRPQKTMSRDFNFWIAELKEYDTELIHGTKRKDANLL